MSSKHELLKQISLFIGKILLKVENYLTVMKDVNKKEKLLLRISNIQPWEKLVRFLDKFDHSMHLHQTSYLNKLNIF